MFSVTAQITGTSLVSLQMMTKMEEKILQIYWDIVTLPLDEIDIKYKTMLCCVTQGNKIRRK